MKNFSSRVDASSGLVATRLSDTINARVLGANAAETETIPAGATIVIITPVSDTLYIRNGVTPAVPAADVSDGTSPIAIPTGTSRIFDIGDWSDIRMISTLANIVTLEYYK